MSRLVLRPALRHHAHGVVVAAEAPAVDWWLAGGISAANCIAAYQAKGAASLAASYTNLANPGSYNAAAPVAAPTFDAATGWTFNGSTQYLTTGIIPANNRTQSVLVRIANATAGNPFGTRNGTSYFFLRINTSSQTGYYYGASGTLTVAGATAAGVLGWAGTTAYKDGVSQGTTPGSDPTFAATGIALGAYYNGSIYVEYLAGDILAWVMYDAVLDASQAVAVTTAMAAL